MFTEREGVQLVLLARPTNKWSDDSFGGSRRIEFPNIVLGQWDINTELANDAAGQCMPNPILFAKHPTMASELLRNDRQTFIREGGKISKVLRRMMDRRDAQLEAVPHSTAESARNVGRPGPTGRRPCQSPPAGRERPSALSQVLQARGKTTSNGCVPAFLT
jgi:hypothetical protein